MHQKCSKYTLTNLLFGLCKFVWVIDLLVILPNLHPGVPTRPFTPKVLRAKERAPTPYPYVVFTFKLIVEFTKEFGGASFLQYLEMLQGFYCKPWLRGQSKEGIFVSTFPKILLGCNLDVQHGLFKLIVKTNVVQTMVEEVTCAFDKANPIIFNPFAHLW